MDIGATLQAARRQRGWTQEQLARRVGVTRQHLGRVEATGRVSLHLLQRLTAILSIPTGALFGRRPGKGGQ
jgi:transcriptional regulator with XRE-family HTH domain